MAIRSLLIFFLLSGFSTFSNANGSPCPYGYFGESPGAQGLGEKACGRYPAYVGDFIHVAVGASNGGYCDVIVIYKNYCASTPADDTGKDGCYEHEASGGYCEGEKKTCSDPGGDTYILTDDKSCEDYCPGGISVAGKPPGKVHQCNDGENDGRGSDNDLVCEPGQVKINNACVNKKGEPETDPDDGSKSCPEGSVYNSYADACLDSADPNSGGGSGGASGGDGEDGSDGNGGNSGGGGSGSSGDGDGDGDGGDGTGAGSDIGDGDGEAEAACIASGRRWVVTENKCVDKPTGPEECSLNEEWNGDDCVCTASSYLSGGVCIPRVSPSECDAKGDGWTWTPIVGGTGGKCERDLVTGGGDDGDGTPPDPDPDPDPTPDPDPDPDPTPDTDSEDKNNADIVNAIQSLTESQKQSNSSLSQTITTNLNNLSQAQDSSSQQIREAVNTQAQSTRDSADSNTAKIVDAINASKTGTGSTPGTGTGGGTGDGDGSGDEAGGECDPESSGYIACQKGVAKGTPFDPEKDFKSLADVVEEKRASYLEEVGKLKEKFKDLASIETGNANPFIENTHEIMGVSVDFGTGRFQEFLAFLPALILFIASVTAAHIMFGGKS